jgi:hypothetical protein
MRKVKAKIEITVPVPLAERAGLHSSIEKAQPQIDKISAHGNNLHHLTGNRS